MSRDRPILNAFIWGTIGFLIGVVLMLALTKLPTARETNDQILDEQARHG